MYRSRLLAACTMVEVFILYSSHGLHTMWHALVESPTAVIVFYFGYLYFARFARGVLVFRFPVLHDFPNSLPVVPWGGRMTTAHGGVLSGVSAENEHGIASRHTHTSGVALKRVCGGTSTMYMCVCYFVPLILASVYLSRCSTPFGAVCYTYSVHRSSVHNEACVSAGVTQEVYVHICMRSIQSTVHATARRLHPAKGPSLRPGNGKMPDAQNS